MRRNAFALIILLSFLCGQSVRASDTSTRTDSLMQLDCAQQVFPGTLQFSVNAGDGYKAVPTYAVLYLRSIMACPITSPVKLGALQRVMLMSDQIVMVVYSSPNGGVYYVHRAWQVFAISAEQWGRIVGLLDAKGMSR